MTDTADRVLAEILIVQRQILAAHEASLANQRELMDRQRGILRLASPLMVVFVVFAIGPYLWNLVAYFANR